MPNSARELNPRIVDMSLLEIRTPFALRLLRVAVLSALPLGSGQILGSTPAGADTLTGYSGDKNDIYHVQQGDLMCSSREACGGAAAVPAGTPGYWYLPGGLLKKQQQPQAEPAADEQAVPAAAPAKLIAAERCKPQPKKRVKLTKAKPKALPGAADQAPAAAPDQN
jgi:hypothetical protein